MSESSWLTSYSQEERIAKAIYEDRQKELEYSRVHESSREEIFGSILEDKDLPMFSMPELSFYKFTHEKIRFVFDPSKITKHVSKKTLFRCSLEYLKTYRRWHVRRDSFPVNYKRRIYGLFYDHEYFTISDAKLIQTILRIRDFLVDWAKNEEEYRVDKFMRYQNGVLEYIELDTDDEELFLTKEERIKLNERRNIVLRRMIPPNKRSKIGRRIIEPLDVSG